MKVLGVLLAFVLSFTAAIASDDVPDRDALMQPAPNPAWNKLTPRGYDTHKIADGLYTFRLGTARNIFLVTDDGVIATDPISPEAAAIYREEIRKVTDQPVKYVVYSHDHWDHVPGAQIFKDEGAQVVSHALCAKQFRELPNSDVVMPDITFWQNYRLTLGGRSLDLLYFGPNHGECMVVMRPDPGNMLFIVDLITPGGMPLSYIPDYDLPQWIRTLKEIEAVEGWDTMIGGHGPVLAHRSALSERREYLELLVARAEEVYAQGGNPLEMSSRIRLPEFSHLRGYEQQIDMNAQRALAIPAIGW